MPEPTRKILAITLEPISRQMAGPAIRCVELSKQLAQQFDVTVYSPRESDLKANELCPDENFHLVCAGNKRDFYQLARQCDILFIQANVLKAYPLLANLNKYLVVDLYDPYLLAVLAQFETDNASAHASYNLMHKVLEKHMITADFSVCASERQRDYWLGRFCSLGRLTPQQYGIDNSFRQVIDVVPFGLPAKAPKRSGAGMKGIVPGIAEDDFVLLWGGGIWQWFDPLTIIKAVAELNKELPRLKLYFLGFKSPNPQVPLMEMAIRSKQLADELGATNKSIFFCDTWTSYEQRANFLLDADAAVSAHFDLPETRFSFRTRILDYLWAGLPVLTTCGDQLADLIQTHQAGQALDYGDVNGWKIAIKTLMNDPLLAVKYRDGAKELAAEFSWDKVVQPLLRYCQNPHKLPKHHSVRMPSLVARARAIYSRGGKELVMKRTSELLGDILRR